MPEADTTQTERTRRHEETSTPASPEKRAAHSTRAKSRESRIHRTEGPSGHRSARPTSQARKNDEASRRPAERADAGMSKKHPGFQSVEQGIADKLKKSDPKISGAKAKEEAGAELAAATRGASKSAVKKNPRLLHVKRKAR